MARPRLVCHECGSADLIEHTSGHREFSVTYYVDGSWDDRSGDAWEVDTWDNSCNDCGADLAYDQLVAEAG